MIRARVAVARPGSVAFTLEDAVLPEPREHDVVVDITASGVCHSQLHQIAQAGAGEATSIRALGHEATGVVRAVGNAVTAVEPGRHVLISWIPNATSEGRAPLGSYAVLSDGSRAESPDAYTWATTTVVDEQFVYALDAAPAFAVSVIGCAVPTGAGAVINTGGVRPGDTVAVIGVGGVGISAVAAARAIGASKIIAIDVDPVKLAYARTMGATETVDSSGADAATRMLAQGMGGIDTVIDCVAAQSTFDLALAISRDGIPGQRAGGTVVLVGVARSPLTLDARTVQLREKRIFGSFGGSSVVSADFPTYLEWVATGKLDLDALVSRYYDLDHLEDAVDDLRHGRILGRGVLIL